MRARTRIATSRCVFFVRTKVTTPSQSGHAGTRSDYLSGNRSSLIVDIKPYGVHEFFQSCTTH
eukprot:scaffold329392_cov22-Prasinocladus_malaysianus.AAC.2